MIFVLKTGFVVWLLMITGLAVMPYSQDGLLVKSNVTPSGMEKHVVGYFAGACLLYFGYRRGARGSGLIILGYSVLLEISQAFLPYRTFNPYDLVGNGIGVGAFWLVVSVVIRKKGFKEGN